VEEESFPYEKWDEIITAVHGACEWCAAVARAVHLCELTVLSGVEAPVLYGVGQDSAYEQRPAFLEKPGTVLIQRELLIEKQNPGSDFGAKIAGLACILAHEMAHHALRHDWDARQYHREVSALPLEQRRWVLETLDAPKLAATTGLPYEVIVDHWGIADDAMLAKLLEYAADQSDEQAMRADDDSSIEHADVHEETGIHIAEEWGAAVVGCMMYFRWQQGRDYATRMAQSILDELPTTARSSLVETVLMAACQNPDAENAAIARAIGTLETAFQNPDIQECEQERHGSDRDWAALFSQAGD